MKYNFKSYYLFGFYCLCFSACNNSAKSSEEIKLNDSVSIIKTYYDNGDILGAVLFKNGKRDGISKMYYENGKLEEIGLYKNDKEDSTWVSYHSNGNIENVVNYVNGLTLGEEYDYYSNKKIKRFAFNDDKGPVYARDYDTLGNIIYEGGFPALIVSNKFNLAVNEKFEVKVVLGLLPEWDPNVTFTDITNRANVILKEIMGVDDFYQGRFGKSISFSKHYTDSGNYKWKLELKIVDRIYHKELRFKDTLKFTVK